MSLKILIVDDSKVNLIIGKTAFKGMDAEIDTALSGDECLEKAREKKYDLILLDQMMPGKDGITTFKEFKTMEGNLNTETPVIMVTASEDVTAEDYLKEGLSGYLKKPFKAEEIRKLTDNL